MPPKPAAAPPPPPPEDEEVEEVEEEEEEGEEEEVEEEEVEEEGEEAAEEEEGEEGEEDEEWEEVKLKIKCGGETRALTVTSTTTYESFLNTLKVDYGGLGNIKYEDGEGDVISIRNQHDLVQAFDFYLQQLAPAGKALKLTLEPGADGATSTQAISSVSSAKTISSPASNETAKIDSSFASMSVSGAGGSLKKTESASINIEVGANFKWKKGNLIGKGACGSVYMGMMEKTGMLMAVKCVELGQLSNPKDMANFQREVDLMKGFQHRNIVRYYGSEVNQAENVLYIFLEYVPGGSLQSLIKKFCGLPESTVRHYTAQILCGLNYLHTSGVIHRDIKGDNILADDEGCVKLADFGCSKQLNELCSKTHGCNTMVGTPYWMAPEVIADDSGYGFKADIWSIGCTVCEMIIGKPPWPEFESMWSAIYHIANSSGPPPGIPTDISPTCSDFLDKTFIRDVNKRWSAAELLEHPFCKDLPQ